MTSMDFLPSFVLYKNLIQIARLEESRVVITLLRDQNFWNQMERRFILPQKFLNVHYIRDLFKATKPVASKKRWAGIMRSWVINLIDVRCLTILSFNFMTYFYHLSEYCLYWKSNGRFFPHSSLRGCEEKTCIMLCSDTYYDVGEAPEKLFFLLRWKLFIHSVCSFIFEKLS